MSVTLSSLCSHFAWINHATWMIPDRLYVGLYVSINGFKCVGVNVHISVEGKDLCMLKFSSGDSYNGIRMLTCAVYKHTHVD
jgi:hypothetical protein